MAACFRVSPLVVICTIILYHVAEAQTCIMGFPDTASLCTSPGTSCGIREVSSDNRVRTRIIPEMTFTCSGTVTHWRAAGEFGGRGGADTNSVLSIWRERSSESGTYDRIYGIELGICGSEDPAPSVTGMSNVYECILPQSETMLVQPGDIVGVELPPANRAKFRPYFDNSGSGPANYEFNSHAPMFPLTGSTIPDQPQISMTVVRTTVPPSSITEALSTDPPTTQLPTHSTEATSMAATGPAPTEASNIAMTTEKQTSTNITGAPETTTMETTVTTETTATEALNTQRNFSGTNGAMEQQSGSNVAAIAGAAVGGIIAVLLVLIIVLLLVLVLRRQNLNGQKFTPSNNSTIVNPIYDDNIAIKAPNPEAGVYSVAEGADYSQPADYEDIDNTKPTLPPADMFANSINDYSRTPHPFEMSTYEMPVQTTMSKDFMAGHSFGDVGVLYVPSQEQRNSLPKDGTNGDIYSAIGMRQYSESGAAPMLFEEDDTYWVPATDANELYKQLSAKKYREIVRKQIQVTDHLGSGQFGTVNKGIWQSPMGAMDVAVKQLQPGASEEEKVKFLQEAAINGQFRHPNVVKLMGVVTVGEPTMIVLELLSNGDLHNYLLKLQPSPGEILPSNTQQLLLKFCQQVASGMDYLARKAFVHRDLAARNILVADDKTCKISDFGMSRDLMDENYYVSHGGKVPVKWTAPEAIHYKKYSTASDMWSYGCLMYEIWSLGHKPYEAYRNAEVIKIVDEGYRLPPPPGLPKELYKIMIQCWHPDRSSRPSFPQLVEMLSRADFELFAWEEEDLRNSDPQVKLIGAPLEIAKDLYHELQRSYLSS